MHNWTLIEATWPHWRRQGLDWWTRLTESEWDDLDGNRVKLIELLQAKYGWTNEEAEQEIESRFKDFGESVTQ